jgi:hypothetical protein
VRGRLRPSDRYFPPATARFAGHAISSRPGAVAPAGRLNGGQQSARVDNNRRAPIARTQLLIAAHGVLVHPFIPLGVPLGRLINRNLENAITLCKPRGSAGRLTNRHLLTDRRIS